MGLASSANKKDEENGHSTCSLCMYTLNNRYPADLNLKDLLISCLRIAMKIAIMAEPYVITTMFFLLWDRVMISQNLIIETSSIRN